LAVILVGEYILHLLPRGTHQYRKLIRPGELKAWSQQAGLQFEQIASLKYNPFTGRFKVARDQEGMNYMVCFVRAND